METNTKLHVVMFPWLAMGHLIPFFKLSKFLAQKGHLVSFISTPRNLQRLPMFPQNLSDLINLVAIPLPSVNNLPHQAESSMDIPQTKAQFLKIAFDLLQPDVSSFLENSSPKPDWIVYDYASHWVPDLAAKAGVSSAYFSLFTAATLAFYTGPPSIRGEDGRSKAEDFTVVPKWIPFKSSIKYHLYEVSKYVESSAGNESGTSDVIRFAASVGGCDILLFRTCVEFEPEWFSLACELYKKPVVPVGVLPDLPPSFEDEEMSFFENWFRIKNWLDRQNADSVVYVALGTEAVLDEEQVQELAIGLEKCGLPFFWVLRNDPGSTKGVLDMLPEGFMGRIKDHSMVCTEWVPQVDILSHQAIGGFLSHCGWNSAIEALSFGRVLIMLPVMNDQGLNARLLQEKGVGLEIPRDVKDGSFTRADVAETVRFVVVSEEGASLRANARDMRALFGNVEKNQTYIDSLIHCLLTKRRSP